MSKGGKEFGLEENGTDCWEPCVSVVRDGHFRVLTSWSVVLRFTLAHETMVTFDADAVVVTRNLDVRTAERFSSVSNQRCITTHSPVLRIQSKLSLYEHIPFFIHLQKPSMSKCSLQGF